jgi:hypothetical protein
MLRAEDLARCSGTHLEPATQDAEAGGQWVQGQPGQLVRLLHTNQRAGMKIKWQSTSLASERPWVQSPVLKKKREREREREDLKITLASYWVPDHWQGQSLQFEHQDQALSLWPQEPDSIFSYFSGLEPIRLCGCPPNPKAFGTPRDKTHGTVYQQQKSSTHLLEVSIWLSKRTPASWLVIGYSSMVHSLCESLCSILRTEKREEG